MYLPGQSSCHLHMACQLLQNMTSGHIKVKKGTGHGFYMAFPSHATESVLHLYTLPGLKEGTLLGSESSKQPGGVSRPRGAIGSQIRAKFRAYTRIN